MLWTKKLLRSGPRFVGEARYNPQHYGSHGYGRLNGEEMVFSIDLPGMEDGGREGQTMERRDSVGDMRRTPAAERGVPVVGRFDTGRVNAFNHEGMKATAAAVLLVLLMAALAMTYIVARSRLNEASKGINSARLAIQQVTSRNDDLKRELAEREADVQVSMKAVKMGMISSRGANMIYLTAPEDAKITPSDNWLLSGDRLASLAGGN